MGAIFVQISESVRKDSRFYLGRRPRRRAQRGGSRGGSRAVVLLRQAKVADLASALPHENVQALQVPVRHLPRASFINDLIRGHI